MVVPEVTQWLKTRGGTMADGDGSWARANRNRSGMAGPVGGLVCGIGLGVVD